MESSLESNLADLPLPNDLSISVSEFLIVKVEWGTEARSNFNSSSLVFPHSEGNNVMSMEERRFKDFKVANKEFTESSDRHSGESNLVTKARVEVEEPTLILMTAKVVTKITAFFLEGVFWMEYNTPREFNLKYSI